MIAEQLKKSILQAAIQGKLTQQLPEDGDARDLLKEIQKEKARLIKEGKIKKEKPLPEITEDEIPFEIPENWCWVRLGECLDVRDGTHDSPKYVSNGVPLVTSKNINGGKLDLENTKLISRQDANKINIRSKVDPEDILFAMIGSIGNPVLIEHKQEFCIKNVALFKNINNLMSMKFMLLFFEYIQFILKKEASGGVQSFISLNHFRNFMVPLPTRTEQQRIAERIEELLPEIESLKNDETKLEELQKSFPKKMKDAILQYAIQGKLTQQLPEDGDARDLLKDIRQEKARLIKEGKIKKEKPLPEITEDEIPFEIPENWCWVRLGEIGRSFSDGVHFAPKYHSYGVPCLSAKDIYNDQINFNKCNYISEKDYSLMKHKIDVQVGSLLFTKSGSIGRTCIVRNDIKYGLVESVGVINLINVDSSYVKIVFDLIFDGTGISNIYTNGIGVKHLTLTLVRNILIPLPPITEQKRILERLKEFMPLCKNLE